MPPLESSSSLRVWRALACALATVAFSLAAVPASATILLFDEARDAAGGTTVVPASAGSLLPLDYGDNVSAAAMPVPGGVFTYGEAGEGFTPDVSVEIFTSLATPTDPGARQWQSGYGDLTNIVFSNGPGTQGAPQLFVRLSAAPGFAVDLYGFDLAGFGQDYTIAGVSVLDGSTALFSATNVLIEGNALGALHTSFDFATPLSAQELLVVIDVSNLAASIQDNVGLDNVRIGQTPPRVVPEPSALALASLAAIGLGWRRRRAAA